MAINPLWIRQVKAVLGLELRRTMFSSRAALLYILTLIPIGISALFLVVRVIVGDDGDFPNITGLTQELFPGFFVVIYRGLLYIGCVWTFMNLFRGDVLDRSLHYYFLAPIRREVLIAGKFVAGVAVVTIFFSVCTIVSRLLIYLYYGTEGLGYLMSARGLGQTFAYISVIVMASFGWGAIFMVVGLFLKNPIVTAVLIFGWEFANPFLPALLKKFSVVFYADSLLPVRMEGSPFALIADPVPLYFAIPGFVLFTAATLVIAGLRIRKMEISYSVE